MGAQNFSACGGRDGPILCHGRLRLPCKALRKMNRIVYRGPRLWRSSSASTHIYNILNFLARVPDLPRPRLRAGSRRTNYHRGKNLFSPLSCSRHTPFYACSRPGSTLPSSSTTHQLSDIIKSCAYSPDTVPSTFLSLTGLSLSDGF